MPDDRGRRRKLAGDLSNDRIETIAQEIRSIMRKRGATLEEMIDAFAIVSLTPEG